MIRTLNRNDDAALVNVNHDFFGRIDVPLDQLRKKEEESGARMMKVDDDQENGFQMKGIQELKVEGEAKGTVLFHIHTKTAG
ncbi:UNVERIFIED_CONTAM: hypothetical protein Sradi_0501600 [Sesamum radiatum]|uniref:Uncharacterized protein n=1 Tax=Sesamum radiatum TaxID=300843 RepID=A0AAW2VLU8_SESRA